MIGYEDTIPFIWFGRPCLTDSQCGLFVDPEDIATSCTGHTGSEIKFRITEVADST